MKSQPQNPEFRIDPENGHPCIHTHKSNNQLSKILFENQKCNYYLENDQICFGAQKNNLSWDGSFEYPQHAFW